MRFFVRRLGCPKNDVDADYICARLVNDGHEPVTCPEKADAVIVNTCGFIRVAKEESIDEILRLSRLKKSGSLRMLYASGCLPQRYGEEMLREMPELDGAFGHGVLDSIAGIVGNPGCSRKPIRIETDKLTYLDWKSRFISDDFPFAYLKIADGCNRGCTFCVIPSMRGRYRSRPLEAIVDEARFLAARSKRELILVSQEATLWGNELAGRPSITTLLEALEKINGIAWIRLLYLYPGQVDEGLVEYLAADNKTLSYFDLPFQHVNADILSGMGRRIEREEIERLISTIRQRCPQSVIRTTFMVGFPGETEEQFDELVNCVTEYEFDRLGVFVFSREEGTVAANMPNQVPADVQMERMDRLMSLQYDIAFRKNNSLIGKEVEVIIDTVEPGKPAVGRTRGDCPEIDQEVYVSGQSLQVGDICPVRIDAVDGYDLAGTRVTE